MQHARVDDRAGARDRLERHGRAVDLGNQKGVVVGEGDSYDEAMDDVKSAIRFHIDTFGLDVLDVESPVLEAFVAEAEVTR